MTKRRTKSQSPEERERAEALRKERKAEVARLKAQPDVRVVVGADGAVGAAQRIDVFAMLFQRKSLTDAQEQAVRRLESDMHIAAGAEGSSEIREAVQGGGCQERVTQRMIDASARVRDVIVGLHRWEARLLAELLSPTDPQSALTRWRGTVLRLTGVINPSKQSERVCVAVEALAEVYGAIDYDQPRRARA